MPIAAITIVIASGVVAVLGVVLTTRASRGSAGEADGSTRTDLAAAVSIAGLVGVLFGSGYLGYLLLMQN